MFKAPGIKASGSKPRLGEFDYIQHVLKLAGRKSRVVVKTIDKADHSFANREARDAVREEIENWLATNFPLTDPEVSAQPTPQSSIKYNQSSPTKTMRPPSNQDCALEGR